MSQIYFSPSTGGWYDKAISGLVIPDDAIAIDRDQYHALVESGMPLQAGADGRPVAAEVAAPSPVPRVITPVQAFTALEEAGLLQRIYNHINSASTPLLVRMAFYGATEWRRDSLLVMNTAIALELTADQVDQLFIDAGKVVV